MLPKLGYIFSLLLTLSFTHNTDWLAEKKGKEKKSMLDHNWTAFVSTGAKIQAVQTESEADVTHEAAHRGPRCLPPGTQVAWLGQDGAWEAHRYPDRTAEVAQVVRDWQGGQEFGWVLLHTYQDNSLTFPFCCLSVLFSWTAIIPFILRESDPLFCTTGVVCVEV